MMRLKQNADWRLTNVALWFQFPNSGGIIAGELPLNITRSIRKQKQQVSSSK